MGATSQGPGRGSRSAFGYHPQIDGLRAVAVLSVVAAHTEAGFLRGGGVGVDVFFVISGFLITSLLLRELANEGGVDIAAFYRRRAARLLPALAVVGAFTVVTFLVFRPILTRPTLLGVAASLVYSSCWLRALGISSLGWYGHTWSLSVEEHFYLVWPFFIKALRKRSPRTITIVIVGAWVAAILYRNVSARLGASADRLYNSPDFRAEQILAGCALATLLWNIARSGRRLPRGPSGVLAILSTAVLVSDVFTTKALGISFYSFGSTLLALAAASIVGYLMLWPQSIASRLLADRRIVWIGERSYGIYLWHVPLFGLFDLPHEPTLVRAAARTLVIPLTILLAALSFKYVERPLLSRYRSRPVRLPAS